MSATISTIARPVWTKRPGTGLQIFTACWNGIARYFVHRAAIASLRELDDRALQDIGLRRSQIESAVRGFITTRSRATI